MSTSAVIKDCLLSITVICLARYLVIKASEIILSETFTREKLGNFICDISLQMRLLIEAVLVAELIHQ